jgi:hypothetical protein
MACNTDIFTYSGTSVNIYQTTQNRNVGKHYQTTLNHIQDNNFHSRCSKDFKSHLLVKFGGRSAILANLKVCERNGVNSPPEKNNSTYINSFSSWELGLNVTFNFIIVRYIAHDLCEYQLLYSGQYKNTCFLIQPPYSWNGLSYSDICPHEIR